MKNILNDIKIIGSLISPSGFKIETYIGYPEAREKWAYLTLSILDQNGILLYESKKYAAWFNIKMGWDKKDRFWIDSQDTGIDVIASSNNLWQQYIWNDNARSNIIFDVENNREIEIVNWIVPNFLK